MQRIQQLPAAVTDKIAAGEVIERPSSAVKEMLENSIDAGASRIDVELEQGGTELIRIVDDGHGIVAEDLPLVFAKSATSKLRTADDLFQVRTLGFRGEAMASIGGVAKVVLQSRAKDAEVGAEIRCDGSELGTVKPWNGSIGTRIEVRHLFFNIPVRRKFLRTIPTELGHVVESVTRIALAHPHVHVTLRHNGKLVHEIPASAELVDRIGLFFGKQVRDALIPIDLRAEQVRLHGFTADPSCDRGNTKLQYLFLNGRWIRDRGLGHALQEAYRGLLLSGRFAVAFLFLTAPPESVDVNVHPTKSEVRFRDAQAMYHLIRGGIKQQLLAHDLMPKLQVVEPSAGDAQEPIRPEAEETSLFPDPPVEELPPRTIGPSAYAPFAAAPPRPLPESVPGAPAVPFIPPAPPPMAQGPLPASGSSATSSADGTIPRTLRKRAIQIHDAYLVIETPQGMQVIDQHALHERILFEQFRRRVREGKLESQRLIVPEPLELTMEQCGAVLEVKPQLLDLGLDVEDFGNGCVAVSSYPTLLDRIPARAILQSVVDALMARDRPPSRDQLFNHLLATMACKAAVKAGDPLSPEEIDYLMHLREMAEDSHHCPHGRPTSLVFSRQDLDRQFRRI